MSSGVNFPDMFPTQWGNNLYETFTYADANAQMDAVDTDLYYGTNHLIAVLGQNYGSALPRFWWIHHLAFGGDPFLYYYYDSLFEVDHFFLSSSQIRGAVLLTSVWSISAGVLTPYY